MKHPRRGTGNAYSSIGSEAQAKRVMPAPITKTLCIHPSYWPSPFRPKAFRLLRTAVGHRGEPNPSDDRGGRFR
jgi:hypothetical protein